MLSKEETALYTALRDYKKELIMIKKFLDKAHFQAYTAVMYDDTQGENSVKYSF